jgi:hypothetical protein
MNKHIRQVVTNAKHKKRCKILGLKPEEHYCYKAQGKPCSCDICSPKKYKRNIKHKPITVEIITDY